jgi:hypothetical protein
MWALCGSYTGLVKDLHSLLRGDDFEFGERQQYNMLYMYLT